MNKKTNYRMELWDSLELIKTLDDESVDLVITSPPYFIGKAYDTSTKIDDFLQLHEKIIPEIIRVIKTGWSVCWQVGYFVQDNAIMPLDYLLYDVLKKYLDQLVYRNRIVWTYWHGLHTSKRFSGRHEVIVWLTKGKEYDFFTDPIRVPHKYPGKRHSKGPNKWEFSWNPLWKNPSDVWEIPNVKANHLEKTDHPCQFPVALTERLILGLTQPGDVVLDPFAWSGSTWVAALLQNRKFVGFDITEQYVEIAKNRLEEVEKWTVKVRDDVPVYTPDLRQKVAQKPDTFKY